MNPENTKSTSLLQPNLQQLYSMSIDLDQFQFYYNASKQTFVDLTSPR